jgi:MFS family permease
MAYVEPARPILERSVQNDLRRERAAFALLAVVQVVSIMAITLVVVALPAIQRDFGLGTGGLALVTSAYDVSFAGLLMLGGRLSDLHGPRRLLISGLAMFGLASALAGVAWAAEALVLARFAQGCGAALAASAALALVGEVVREPARRERALALWGGLASLGAVGGMLVSGAVAFVSWRWLFAIPATVAALAVWQAPRLLPDAEPRERAPLDVAGAVLATAGLALAGFGLLRAADFGWSSDAARLSLVAGVASLAAFAGVEWRVRNPLLPPGLLRSRRRGVALLAILATSAATAALTFFASLYFQQLRGLTPVQTSAAFVPYAAVLAGATVASGHLVGRAGPWRVLAAGLALAAAACALAARMEATSATWVVVALLAFPAGGVLAFAGATVVALDGAPPGRVGVAGGLANTALQAGPVLGLAVLVAVANRGTARLVAAGVGPEPATLVGYAAALEAAAVALGIVCLLAAVTSASAAGGSATLEPSSTRSKGGKA